MTNWFDQAIRTWITHWGYLAIAGNLLGENTGLPVPGETALMFSSFLANKSTGLRLYYIIPIGIAACTWEITSASSSDESTVAR